MFNSLKYFSKANAFLRKNHLPKPVGCNNAEVNAHENRLGVPLPAAVREYLRFMGGDYEGVLCGTNCFIRDVSINDESLRELLQDNDLLHKLPQRYLMVFCHQGYQIAWIELPVTDPDPICMFFLPRAVCWNRKLLARFQTS